MDLLYLQNIFIYPIKSLGGISLQEAEVEPTGLQHDRRWMLTDKNGMFLTQRKYTQMAMLQVTLQEESLTVSHKKNLIEPLVIPLNARTGDKLKVKIWDDVCTAVAVSPIADEWFSDALGMATQLVYMPHLSDRFVDPEFATNNELVSFADAYPILIIGDSSLEDLNQKLAEPVKMNRFRPNLVFSGGLPFIEDTFDSFRIGNVHFNAVKPCSRCVLTTINQETGEKGFEPLKTLARYRTFRNKVMFGQNLLQRNNGKIKLGDELIIDSFK